MATPSARRVREDLIEIGHRGLDAEAFSRAAARAIRRRVPFDGVCVLTLDPATLLPTAETLIEDALPAEATPRLGEIEVGEPDFNKFRALARAGRPAATLSEATGRDLDRSRRHRELMRPHGFDDELRAAIVGPGGAWGAIALQRGAGERRFDRDDADLLASLSPVLAEGLRQTVLLAAATNAEDAAGDTEVGMLLLAADGSVAEADGNAWHWLADLGLTGSGPVPVAVRAVAGQARRLISAAVVGDAPRQAASVRVPARSGRWLTLRGSVLGDGERARTAVTIEPAAATQLAPLIAAAYGLTDRERAVTELVAQGRSTNEIALRLHLSTYTVQDHLKAVFEKLGVGSRGEVVAQLFFRHYAPRLAAGPPHR
ncbi:MAG: LuxR family transcriptional regulator [Actinobacteria bacterium]|nr:LuxR family transcriptional regulator [Actinomycetota bacterium]